MKRNKAIALKYQPKKDSAPRVVAKGAGKLAEKILQAAREAGVPIREEPDLLEVLYRLEINQEIPPETYILVAEILAWAWRLSGRLKETSGA
ncbi:flagellar biosynthesis protein FlhB [Thermosulfuriphilus ammonigenes]|uniref:Flagellar biosynthesis protein FlhB n=1 Tax=Thermosulfuriphilus ammonigenes TaxID=1936021 RepID=A0A6G7PWM7_9BACT|nr:EscU/YscU/HrcU family type III secretion system export apparatus switch protein [Thermosulfuriphilus ammonigenes]MBA2847883.1 flagellar biosynthesis protein [Thermosulfuriphilus ammonigenes]QIJ71921.1 flagellar biosynthesis protein FlhB [Thermosulfuriphilus ammonigenes]HFB83786.1 flagellar biosynthesis protein FlhB [Thermodesulfatator sp.]